MLAQTQAPPEPVTAQATSAFLLAPIVVVLVVILLGVVVGARMWRKKPSIIPED